MPQTEHWRLWHDSRLLTPSDQPRFASWLRRLPARPHNKASQAICDLLRDRTEASNGFSLPQRCGRQLPASHAPGPGRSAASLPHQFRVNSKHKGLTTTRGIAAVETWAPTVSLPDLCLPPRSAFCGDSSASCKLSPGRAIRLQSCQEAGSCQTATLLPHALAFRRNRIQYQSDQAGLQVFPARLLRSVFCPSRVHATHTQFSSALALSVAADANREAP